MDYDLKDKKVILTGGSRGIGAATVRLFVEQGARVAYCARGQASIDAFQTALGPLASHATGTPCDVADGPAYHAWLAASVSALGGCDVFVGNATGGVAAGDEGWQASFQVDLLSAVRGAEALLETMAAGGGGSVILLSSVNATDNAGAPMAYSAMKAALINYGNQLGAAAMSHGIRVNTVAPGPIHVEDGFWGRAAQQDPDLYKRIAQRHGAGRLGEPIEVAQAIAFLASDAASWITRTNLVVDGGYSQRIQY